MTGATTTALVATTIACPPLGGFLTTTSFLTGAGMSIVGDIVEDDALKDAGDVFVMSSGIAGVAGKSGTITKSKK